MSSCAFYLIFIPTIIIFSLIVFYPSFNLSLFGDDWLAFYRYKLHLGIWSIGQWNHLTYYLTSYGAQDVIMGLLQKIYGFNSTYFYLTNYFFRLLASFTLIPLVMYLTKNKLATFFAVLFFSVTTTGLDATNWVFNMPSYLTIAFFNIFLFLFLKARAQTQTKLLIPAGLLFYLAYITTPIRMTGILPFIFLIEFFWIFQNKNKATIKKVLLRLSVILLIFFFISLTGESNGVSNDWKERFLGGFAMSSQMLSSRRFDFLFYPIVTLGGMILPDISPILHYNQVFSKIQLIFSLMLPLSVLYLIVVVVLVKNISKLPPIFLRLCFFAAIVWNLIVLFIFSYNILTFSLNIYLILLIIGGYLLIISIILFLHFLKEAKISTPIFFSVSWVIISFIAAWWWAPNTIYPTTHRYLIVSAVGISILLATFISLGKQFKHQVGLFALFSIVLLLQSISTHNYLNLLLDSHGQNISNKIWSSIPYIPEIGKDKEPILFYFEGDGKNGGPLHDVITFGFPPHIALLYNIDERSGYKIPALTENWQDVIQAFKEGKNLAAYGYPAKPIPSERIFAFKLIGKDNLVNVSDLARQKLSEIK